MKKLGKIKLNQFSKDELELRELNALKGGCECARCGTCSCYYIFPETGGFDHHVDFSRLLELICQILLICKVCNDIDD